MGSNGIGGLATLSRDAAVAVDLSHAQLRDMFENMLLARALDERMWTLNRIGQAPFAISCQGHEGAQGGIGAALDPSKDWLIPYYRDLALVLRFGMTPTDIMLSMLARRDDPNSGGRQMPGHYGHRRQHIVTTGSSVATQFAQAPGVALATKLRGEDAVTVTCVGEGGTSEGDFHEGLNWASIYKLPVIFVVENNHWAISVPLEKQMAVRDVSVRAAAYGMPGVSVDGGDAVEVYRVAREAVERARNGEGPTLLEAKVIRITPHSSDDDHLVYRTKEDLQADRLHDPIVVTRARLHEMGALSDEHDAEIQARVKQAINAATDAAERAPLPEPSTAFEHVYGAEGERV
jgi:2-oxoisovalerate dehydrogenase E1 component alpha subunit